MIEQFFANDGERKLIFFYQDVQVCQYQNYTKSLTFLREPLLPNGLNA